MNIARDAQSINSVREHAVELLLVWDSHPPLLPESVLETEADIADAAVCRSLMLDLKQAATSPDTATLVAVCAKLVMHLRAVQGRALWCSDGVGQTKYGRIVDVLEHHLRALAHVLPKTQEETGATQP